MTSSWGTVEASRFMQTYAKRFNAGAFAVPTAKDLTKRPWTATFDGNGRGTIVAWNTLTRGSSRGDWMGRRYEIPAGSVIATHIARDEGASVPDWLDRFDVLFCYREDVELCADLERRGRVVWATRISAAAEIIAAYVWPGIDPLPTPPIDRITVTDVPAPEITPIQAHDALAEIDRLDGWDDDYPYYSDGSWSSLSLRGFYDDPTRGVKPAEMDKAWKVAHPDDLDNVPRWTSLIRKCPTLEGLVRRVEWWGSLERVRILRMAGTSGKPHVLRRHSDITDRDFGPGIGSVVRFHLPLVTAPEIKMTTWDLDGKRQDHHLEAWRWWYLDARKPHMVMNPTSVDRIHLTVDVISDRRLQEVLCSAST